MNIADHLVANWLLALSALFISLFVGWFLDKRIAMAELGFVTEDGNPNIYYKGFRFVIRYVSPAAIVYILYSVIMGTGDFS